MKKVLLFLTTLMFFCSCTNCEHEVLTTAKVELSVNNLISTDRQQMFLNYGENYKWFETLLVLNDYLDEENDGSVAEVVNIFQAATQLDENSFDVKVYKFQHFADGTNVVDSISGFWIEDSPLVDSLITIPYDSAYALIQRVNLPKPHSKHVCLRTPLGPLSVNPQWVFGNIHEQLWVDAFTGEIKQSNPAFPEGFQYAFSW